MDWPPLCTAEKIRINRLSNRVIGAALKVHSNLGPGLLEKTYEVCLAHELRRAGHEVNIQVGLPIVYEGIKVDLGYRIDLLIDNCLIVELKASEAIAPVHKTQLLSYLRLSGNRLGLLINFHVDQLKDGIVRIANHF